MFKRIAEQSKNEILQKDLLVLIPVLLIIPQIVFALGMQYPVEFIEHPFNVEEIIEKTTKNRLRENGFLIDTNVVYVSAPNHQYFPSVAFDGTNYLVVWEDTRGGSGYSDIYGARVSPEGEILDPAGILISTAVNDQRYPAMAFGNAGYLVVWQDWRSGANFDIYGARVTPDGMVLDPAGNPNIVRF